MEQETRSAGIQEYEPEAAQETQEKIARKGQEPVGGPGGRQRDMEHGLYVRRALGRPQGPGLQRHGRLQPRGTCHGRRAQLSRQEGRGDPWPSGGGNRSAENAALRQRPRVHLEDLGEVVQKEKGGTDVHPTGQADAERLYGKVEQVLPRGRAGRLLVQRPAPSENEDGYLDGGL